MREIDGRRFLTSHEVAKLLDINPTTLQRWVKNEKKTRTKPLRYLHDPLSGRLLFEETSVKRLLAAYNGHGR